MFTYTFSRREKILLGALGVAAVLIAWYFLVFQHATGEINSLNNEISTLQTQQATDTAMVAKKKQMQKAIEEYKQQGVVPREIPAYDNAPELMAELNNIMGKTRNYTIKFGDPDLLSDPDYVTREVKISYGTDTFEQAEAVIFELGHGRYPCRIDEISIVNPEANGGSGAGQRSGSPSFLGTVQATFYEKADAETIAEAKNAKQAEDAKKNGGTKNQNAAASK